MKSQAGEWFSSPPEPGDRGQLQLQALVTAKSPQFSAVPRWLLKPGGYARSVFLCAHSAGPPSGSLGLGHLCSQQEPPRRGFCEVREPCWSEQLRGFRDLQMGAGFPWQLLLPGLPCSRTGTLGSTHGYSIPRLLALQVPLNRALEARLQSDPPAPWVPGCPSLHPVPVSFSLQRLPSPPTLMVRKISCGENREG